MNNEYYYFFDCLDGVLGEVFLTLDQIRQLQGDANIQDEGDVKLLARDLEATLYRYEKAEDGTYINETCLYDCGL